MYVCGSGLQLPIAYSLWGGGVSIPEQRLCWALDSVPIFSLLQFPFSDVLGPPLSPLHDSPGFLSLQCLFPVSSLFLHIDSSPSVSVSSAVHLQQRLSPVVLPSEVFNPPADGRPNALLLVSCPAVIRRFSPPPPLTCAARGNWLVCRWRGKGDVAPNDSLEFLNAPTGIAQDSVPSSTLEVPLRLSWYLSLCMFPPPPFH